MKLTVLFLLAAFFQAEARVTAQTITLRVKNEKIEKVFNEIRKQTGYYFVYNNRFSAQAKPVNIVADKSDLQEVLRQCFENQPFTYEIQDKIIVIKEKTVASRNADPALSGTLPPPTNIDVTVTVLTADGLPLEGASVLVKGNSKGVAADINGRATLKNIDPNATLVVSFTGYQNQEIKINSRITVSVYLQPSTKELEEVIINKGYYSERQKVSVSNTGRVTAKEIERQPVNNPLLALQGRVPGLYITQANGIPGGGITIQINGQNSIGNRNDPLYVIDGVPYFSQNPSTVMGGNPFSGSGILGQTLSGGPLGSQGNPLSYINPADIESIDILKDAEATAIYGTKAANGAILITTKKGKVGQTKVDFNIQQGWGKVGHFIDLLNTPQYMQMRKEAKRNDNATILSSDYDLNGLWDTTRYTNWQKELIGGTAQYSQYSGTVSGGTTNMQYFVGGTYHRETTVFPGDFANNTGSVHFNISSATANQKFRIQFSGSYMASKSNLPGRDFTRDIFLSPVAPALYNADGTLNWAPNPNANGTSTWSNPLAQNYNLYDNQTNSLVSSAVLSYLILPDLELKSSLGYTSLFTNEFAAILLNSVEPESRPNFSRSANFTFNTIKSWIIEPQLNYRKTFLRGKIDFLIGSSVQQQENDGKVITASGQPNDQLLRDFKSATSFSSNNSDISTYKYNGVFSRLNYNWKDKYILALTARRDGSSRFGDKNKFHNFASVGLGWIFSEETFAKKTFPFLSFGKIRGSYGSTGSDQINNYGYLNLYNTFNTGNPYQGTSSLAPRGLSNPYLQWEETRKLQSGIDLGLFHDRISLSATYIRNRSSNQLVQYNLPTITGFNSIATNFPALVQNTSWEFILSTVNIPITKNFNWSSSFNLTIPHNKLVSFPNLATSPSSGNLIIGNPVSISRITPFYGVDPLSGVYLVYNHNGNPTSNPSYPTDFTILYTTDPKFYGGFENSFKYKGVQLDFLFQFSQQKNFNLTAGEVIPGKFSAGSSLTAIGQGNQPVTVLARWQKPGDITAFQRYSSNNSLSNFYPGDRDLGNMYYIKLKNLSVSYQFTDQLIKKAHLKNCRLFLNAQNLFTITPYKGLDPENMSTISLPPLRVITVGAQLGL